MAKTTGPLFSMDASGAFGGALVYSKWKGRPTVRQLVTPANPHSSGQEQARNRIRTGGVAQKWAFATTMKAPSQSITDKARLIAKAPAGFAWNGFLVDSMIGTGFVDYTAAAAAWAALTGGEKTAWDTAAAALTPAFGVVPQTTTGGGSATALTAGQAFFHYVYGLFKAGLSAAPTATPPTYTA